MVTAAPAKAKRASPKSKGSSSGKATYLKMIQDAIKSADAKKGATRDAIKKFIATKYRIDFSQKKNASLLNRAIKKALASQALKNGRTSGTFKIVEQAKKAKKARKPKAKKAKSSKPKKSAKSSPAKKARQAKPKSVKKAPAKAKAAKKPANEQ